MTIFSDLDGTLLDHDSYDWSPAQPALDAVAAREVLLVLCSSKTRAEMRQIATAMRLDAPLIVENGGAVWMPGHSSLGGSHAPRGAVPDVEDDGQLLVLGTRTADLRAALARLADEVGVPLRGFGEMTADEVAERTGLPLSAAVQAHQREFSEPFVTAAEVPLSVLDSAARLEGLQVTRGGRFFHLLGASDKGHAVRVVCQLLGQKTGATLGFGDAPNDLPLLRAVETPVIVPRPDGTPHPDLVTALPQALIAPAPGPTGWNAATLAWLARTQ